MTKYSCAYEVEKRSFVAPIMRKISQTVLLACLAVLVGGAVAYYLSQINYISEKGFAMRDLEKTINGLRDENEKLELRMVELRSMSDLSARLDKLGLVPVGDMTYLGTAEQVVAVK